MKISNINQIILFKKVRSNEMKKKPVDSANTHQLQFFRYNIYLIIVTFVFTDSTPDFNGIYNFKISRRLTLSCLNAGKVNASKKIVLTMWMRFLANTCIQNLTKLNSFTAPWLISSFKKLYIKFLRSEKERYI